MVLPNGEVREIAGDALDLISEAGGITGLITEVAIRVRSLASDAVWGARFGSAAELARALKAVREAELPLWSVNFVNPKLVELKNQLPPHLEHGHVVEVHRPTIPQGYVGRL